MNTISLLSNCLQTTGGTILLCVNVNLHPIPLSVELSVEQMKLLKCSESSTTRTRRVDVSKFRPLYIQTRLRESSCWLDSESHVPRLRSLRGSTDEFFALSEPSPEGQDAVTFMAHPNWDALRGTVRHQGGEM